MPNDTEEPINVSVPPPCRWVWNEESLTVELSSPPAEESVLKQRKQTDANVSDLQQRSEWLARVCRLNDRGRQSTRKSLSPARLNAYRSSLMKRQGDHVTIDDVKQVAVGLLQENYSLPIPVRFLAVIKMKDFDQVLSALLLYLSCFFEYKSLENMPQTKMAVDIITEQQTMVDAAAKKEIAQKRLAVCYFGLIMDLEVEPNRHASRRKCWTSSSGTDWLLHACLYSFFCYVSWVTFGRRKGLGDILGEVGRLLYSDTFNEAVRSASHGGPGTTVDGSAETGEADPKETGRNDTSERKTSQRRPALSSIANQRSPLMVCLLPSPKERSAHLFRSSRPPGQRARRRAKRCDTQALTLELDQRLDHGRFGILGRPLRHFSRSTLIPHEEQKSHGEKNDNNEPDSDFNNNSEDRPGVHLGCGKRSITALKSTGFGSYRSDTRVNDKRSINATETLPSHTK